MEIAIAPVIGIAVSLAFFGFMANFFYNHIFGDDE